MADRLLPLLSQPETVQPLLSDPRLLIIDLSAPESYVHGHIPGAVNLPYSMLLRQEPPAMGLLPTEEHLSEVFSRLGLNPDRHVVAYDDEGNGRAARLLWTLDVIGHADYSLLDGGITAWRAEDRPLESGTNEPQPADYHARISNPEAHADKDHIKSRLDDAGMVVLDARSPAEYSGTDSRAQRGGHIPGAVNLDWTLAIDRDNDLRLKPPEALRELLAQTGAGPDREVVTHCQTHHRSALLYFVMRYLGYPKVRGYDGSWSEWGNAEDTPVETGPAAPH